MKIWTFFIYFLCLKKFFSLIISIKNFNLYKIFFIKIIIPIFFRPLQEQKKKIRKLRSVLESQ